MFFTLFTLSLAHNCPLALSPDLSLDLSLVTLTVCALCVYRFVTLSDLAWFQEKTIPRVILEELEDERLVEMADPQPLFCDFLRYLTVPDLNAV